MMWRERATKNLGGKAGNHIAHVCILYKKKDTYICKCLCVYLCVRIYTKKMVVLQTNKTNQ